MVQYIIPMAIGLVDLNGGPIISSTWLYDQSITVPGRGGKRKRRSSTHLAENYFSEDRSRCCLMCALEIYEPVKLSVGQ